MARLSNRIPVGNRKGRKGCGIFSTVCLFCVAVMLAGCAYYPPKNVLRGIRPGMTRAQVTERLDAEPESTGRLEDYYYMKYYLVDKNSVGTAHFFIYDRNMRLVKWEEDKQDEIVDTGDVIAHLMSPF